MYVYIYIKHNIYISNVCNENEYVMYAMYATYGTYVMHGLNVVHVMYVIHVTDAMYV